MLFRSRDKRLQGGTRNSNQERTEGPYTCSSRSASQSSTGTYDSRELVDIIENQNQAIKRLELEVQRLSKPTHGMQKGKAKEKQVQETSGQGKKPANSGAQKAPGNKGNATAGSGR